MAEKRPGGPEWSSDYVTCSIINNSGSPLTFSGSTSTGGGSFTNASNIPANSVGDETNAVWAFTAYGETGLPSGCGGTVTFHFTNGVQLVLQYNLSVSEGVAWCIPLLQAPSDSSDAGTNSYYCIATDCTAVSALLGTVTIAPLSQAGKQSS
jgi:hypothetical protein